MGGGPRSPGPGRADSTDEIRREQPGQPEPEQEQAEPGAEPEPLHARPITVITARSMRAEIAELCERHLGRLKTAFGNIVNMGDVMYERDACEVILRDTTGSGLVLTYIAGQAPNSANMLHTRVHKANPVMLPPSSVVKL